MGTRKQNKTNLATEGLSMVIFIIINNADIIKSLKLMLFRAVAAAPQTPNWGGPTLPKGAPNCLEGPEVASIQKQSFAWRIALNGIFYAQILYISVLKFFAIVYF